MLRATLRSLLAPKLRLLLSAVAIGFSTTAAIASVTAGAC